MTSAKIIPFPLANTSLKALADKVLARNKAFREGERLTQKTDSAYTTCRVSRLPTSQGKDL